MSNNKRSGLAKNLIIVLPIVLLFASVGVSQMYFSAHPPTSQVLNYQSGQPLQLVGYNNCCNSGEPSLTLTNVDSKNVTILQVTFGGKPFAQGALGGSVAQFAVNSSSSSSSSFCEVPTDDLVFPQTQTWNMDTGGLCSATILPGGDATLYLGVQANNETLPIQIVTSEGNCTFSI